jgi:hypothetical protein
MVYKDIRETSSGLYRGMFSFFVPGIARIYNPVQITDLESIKRKYASQQD